MRDLLQKIRRAAEPLYRGSQFYKRTIWPHAVQVAEFAKDFAVQMGANQFIAEAGGLLHDLGAAMFGRDNHHITGAEQAGRILAICNCPPEFIGSIVIAVFCHRGSQKIPLQTAEAKCVAAGDARDHFMNLQALWNAQIFDMGLTPLEAHKRVTEELESDWQKISPEIQLLLDGTYENARRELVRIASQNGHCRKDRKRLVRR